MVFDLKDSKINFFQFVLIFSFKKIRNKLCFRHNIKKKIKNISKKYFGFVVYKQFGTICRVPNFFQKSLNSNCLSYHNSQYSTGPFFLIFLAF